MWKAKRENKTNWCRTYTRGVLIIANEPPLKTRKNARFLGKNALGCLVKAKNAWWTHIKPKIKSTIPLKLPEVAWGIK
jgi:hypothetical protein